MASSPLIDFGDIDAEIGFRPEYFVPSTAWRKVRSGERCVVIGRKGTGKTALRISLRSEAASKPELLLAELTFRDYPWNAHHAVYDLRVGERSRYVETWSFLLLVELAKLAVGRDQTDRDGVELEYATALRSFVNDNWGALTFDHREVFRKESFRVRKTLKPAVAGVSIGEVEWATVDRSRLGDMLRGMNEWLREALSHVLRRDAEYFLVFDELDIDFDPDDAEYRNSIIGLLGAARVFHAWASDLGVSARPLLLLREDIYDALHFQDKNKLTTSLVQELVWRPVTDGADALKAVIDARVSFLSGSAPDSDPWRLVFSDEEIARRSPYRYMVSRGLLRPRDLVVYCNIALEQARRDGDELIGPRHIEAAGIEYSRYLLRELDDEIRSHHPAWRQWLELLRGLRHATFQRSDFRNRCAARPVLTEGASPEEILEALYRFGVIGMTQQSFDKAWVAWAYQNPEVTFDPRAPSYTIHAGLLPALPGFQEPVADQHARPAPRLPPVPPSAAPPPAVRRPAQPPLVPVAHQSQPLSRRVPAVADLTWQESSALQVLLAGGGPQQIALALRVDDQTARAMATRLRDVAARVRGTRSR